MFRWLIVCTLLAAGAVSLVYLASGLIHNPTPAIGGEDKLPTTVPVVEDAGNAKQLTVFGMGKGGKAAAADTVIPGGRVYPVDTQDVPSERDGKLICIATDLKPGEVVPPDRLEKDVTFAFLVIELAKAEKATGPTYALDGKTYRRWQEGEELAAERIRVHKDKHNLRILQVGEHVEQGQLLAVVNPSIPVDELTSKVAKLDAAAADVRVSEKTKLEAQKRYDSAVVAKRGNAISEDDFRAAKLAWDRYIEEEQAKKMAVRQAQAEVQAALTTLKTCEIRSPVRGRISGFAKKAGEGVRSLETVLQIEAAERPHD
jgi:biotin carboxyl carrier protein